MEGDFIGELYELRDELDKIPAYERPLWLSNEAELGFLGGISMTGISAFLLAEGILEKQPIGCAIGAAGIALGSRSLYRAAKRTFKDYRELKKEPV